MIGESFPAVLAAARSGEEWAWTSLYRDISPVILGYLRTRGAAEAEDLLGETWLQSVRRLDGFIGDERAFRAWLLTIAHRRSIDGYRRQSRRPEDVVPHSDFEAAGPVGNVEDEAVGRVATERLVQALGVLTSDQQAVLALRLIADLSVDEVARVLGKRVGAIKALQRRGLASLRKELSEREYPSDPIERFLRRDEIPANE